ncbi:uncharacterized protein isoform X2 [Leptinotarsa decemlineata]|uniref:uncharacterized protein isoform X2 n=1 Tax=Leptinotarsa decemlineata TaxID=7539 RepID=UPI003D30A989
MYCVVQYANGFVEILLSKRVKKRKGYAVAKNYQVEILYENENESLCTQFLDTFSQDITNAENDAEVGQQEINKNIDLHDQVVNTNSDCHSLLSEERPHIRIPTENDEQHGNKIIVIDDQLVNLELDLQSPISEEAHNLTVTTADSIRNEQVDDVLILNWDSSGVKDSSSGLELTRNNYDLNVEVQEAWDVLTEHQPEPGKEKSKAPQKKHCCCFCQKRLFKVYRHYTEVHKTEREVREIINLPKKSAYRRSLLDKLRKKGDHLFNTQIKDKYQNDIVCKETIQQTKVKRERNVPCPSCLGYYSKFSIRHHLEKCMPVKEKKTRRNNIQAQCRKFENKLHPKASTVLRGNIFPVLNEDDVTDAIRYDDLVITYANYLCRKYTAEHHSQQIRSNMRAIGRLILAMREINPQINNLTDAFDPSKVDLIIEGIERVAGLDEISNLYRSPATAMLLTTELKKICKLMEIEFIKKQDDEGKKRMEDLYLLFNLEFQVTVNKKGLETQKINFRRKKFDLPKTEQIAKFRIYLESKILHYTTRMSQNYSFKDWTHLTEYSLVHLAIFNRKRPGETQRLLIDDYINYEVIDNEDSSNEMDNLSREQIKKWARIKFTGKLGKNTALLIHRDLGFKAIDLILKYREKAGVSPQNKFVFGDPSRSNTQSTFQACNLIRKFSIESGIENPELLRTRLLRQHLATETARSQVESRLEGRVSDFMSHKRHIHEDYYVLTQKTDDITKVSALLEEFSSVKDVITPIPAIKKTALSNKVEASPTSSSDEEYCPEEDDISPSEFKYVMGKKQKRHPWTSAEKNKAREYFYDNIYKEMEVTKQKAKCFFLSNQELYKHRSAHLIMQWVKCEQKKVLASQSGLMGQRLRWSTPEKEVLRTSSERHSENGTIPSISECELLFEDNKDILKNRTPQSVKAFLYTNIKKQNVRSQSF